MTLFFSHCCVSYNDTLQTASKNVKTLLARGRFHDARIKERKIPIFGYRTDAWSATKKKNKKCNPHLLFNKKNCICTIIYKVYRVIHLWSMEDI